MYLGASMCLIILRYWKVYKAKRRVTESVVELGETGEGSVSEKTEFDYFKIKDYSLWKRI